MVCFFPSFPISSLSLPYSLSFPSLLLSLPCPCPLPLPCTLSLPLPHFPRPFSSPFLLPFPLFIPSWSSCLAFPSLAPVSNWHSNNDPSEQTERGSPAFDEFLENVGDKIALKNWQGFAGGLDTSGDRMGTHSIFMQVDSAQIMFHVSTYIPLKPTDLQQIERKCHLGNDVVLIVWQDHPSCFFDPDSITSQFNSVFILVQLHKSSTPNHPLYQLLLPFPIPSLPLPFPPLPFLLLFPLPLPFPLLSSVLLPFPSLPFPFSPFSLFFLPSLPFSSLLLFPIPPSASFPGRPVSAPLHPLSSYFPFSEFSSIAISSFSPSS